MINNFQYLPSTKALYATVADNLFEDWAANSNVLLNIKSLKIYGSKCSYGNELLLQVWTFVVYSCIL